MGGIISTYTKMARGDSFRGGGGGGGGGDFVRIRFSASTFHHAYIKSSVIFV